MIGSLRKVIGALGALALSLTGTAAHAASAAQPGQTIGLPTGAQLPIGLILLNTSSFGIRDTSPVQAESNINLPGVVWVPGVQLFGARLHLIAIQPVVAARSAAAGGRYQSGIGVPLLAAQLAWKVTPNFSVSYLFGGYLPIQTQFVINQGSIQQRFAATYLKDGLNLTANMLYGLYPDPVNAQNVIYPDFLNLDLTAAKTFGKWQLGPVAFGSMDLPVSRPTYRRQAQFAVGGLVGYNFGDFFVQAYVTRDVLEQNYGGYDTRGWLRGVFFLYKQAEASDPIGGLLARRN